MRSRKRVYLFWPTEARRARFLTLGALESHPLEDPVYKHCVSGDGVGNSPREILNPSQKLHLFSSVLPVGGRDDVDMRMRDSNTAMRANVQVVLGRHVTQARVSWLLRFCSVNRTLI